MRLSSAPILVAVLVASSVFAAPPARAAAPGSAPPGAEVAAAQPSRMVRFALHKFMQRIGWERDTYTPLSDGGVEAKAIFGFQDRGSLVPLTAEYRLAADGSVRRYQAWGNTARPNSIDDRVVARGDGSFGVRRLGENEQRVLVKGPFAAVSGYAPLLGQELLIQTWARQGRPATVALLPGGTATITTRGREQFSFEGKTVSLVHLAILGLVWGREDVWLDESGHLAAVVTRDAEFDHFEGVLDSLLPILPQLMQRAGEDAVTWLGEVARGADHSPAGAVALVGGRLVDGTGRAPVEDAVVIYQGDRIVAAGPRASTPIPADATRVDVSGKTILPGLWDMHAHFEQVEQGAAYLAAGVTTVRDLGNILEFITAVRDRVAAGKGLGPRLLVDGLVDGEGRYTLGVTLINKPADIEPTLDRLKKLGCLEVKIYSSMRPELVKPIAQAAHRRGMRVTGHIPEGMNILEAIAAGYDGVDHLPSVTDIVLPYAERQKLSPAEARKRLANLDLKGPALTRVFTTMAARKIVMDDTMTIFELFRHSTEENARREPGIGKAPRELHGAFDGVESDAAEHAAVFDKWMAVLGELHRRGVPIVAGTDVCVPGHSLHRELELYVQAGFTPMEAIQAATLVPARAMRLERELGTVERGKRADLVVVAGNPLADIHDIRKVSTVVAHGRLYDPASLWRIAGFTP